VRAKTNTPMAPKTYNPYRKCDFCGANNYPTYDPGRKFHAGAYERRAWTLHGTSNKMTCPNCRKKGEEVERLAIAEVVRHKQAMVRLSEGLAGGEPGCQLSGVAEPCAQQVGSQTTDNRQLTTAHEPPAAYGFGVPGQYRSIKDQYPDALLLFRIGDWYVAMNEDADTVSRELGTTVHRFPPLSTRSTEFAATALDQYLPKLVKAGYRVAICDRIEDANGQRHREVKEHERTDVAAEPVTRYGERPKDKRYREIERKKLLAHLEDIKGVLVRHGVWPDYTGCSKWQMQAVDDACRQRFREQVESIRTEMMLRRVYVTKWESFVIPIGECWVKMCWWTLPEAIAAAKKHYSGELLQEGLPKKGSAPAWAIGNFTDEESAALTLAFAEENAATAASSTDPAVRKHWAEHLAKVKELIEHPHSYEPKRRNRWMDAEDAVESQEAQLDQAA